MSAVNRGQRVSGMLSGEGINLVRGLSDRPSSLSDRSGHSLGLCCVVTPEGTGRTRMVGMGAPDTSGIDLNPARIRGRADLVHRLRQLHTKSGGPTYRDLAKIARSRG